MVGVLSVPTDEATWSPRLRVYFKALNQYHAKRRVTPLGILMVTNLSGFPSSLTVIHVPDGDLRKHRSDFFVNENLKRLNCTGRVGLTLVPPTSATVAKFHQVYRTSDKNEIYHSVIELVKLCQSALLLFSKLEIDYADGLLCDVTERAVNDWWVEIGSEYYTLEPHDGILGPTTVAGLLGLLMGARNRLHSVNAPVSKDPLDVEAMKKGISAFQKSQRLPRTRRLDRRTLERLHNVTQKAAAGEGLYWTNAMLPKKVKSTVAELSGKGGEMVTELVHRKDRAGIAEVETCDIERFVQLCYGERAKWLWYGKAVKRKSVKEVVGAPMRVGEEKAWPMDGKALNFRENEVGGFTWTARKSVADGLGAVAAGGKKEREDDDLAGSAAAVAAEGSWGEDEGVKGLIKRTSGFAEAKSGLEKVKGAVGLGSSQRKKVSKDSIEPPQTPPNRQTQKYPTKESIDSPQTPTSPHSPRHSFEDSPKDQQWPKRPVLRRSRSSPVGSQGSPKSPVQEQMPSWNVAESIPEQDAAPAYAASHREEDTARRPRDRSSPPPSYMSRDKRDGSTDRGQISEEGSESATIEPSIADSVYNDVELNELLPTGPETEQDVNRLLRRTISDSELVGVNLQSHSDDAYPRHLSFSLAEDSVLTWPDLVYKEQDSYFEAAEDQMVDEEFFARESTQLQQMIQTLSSSTATFTKSQLETLESLLTQLSTDQQTFSSEIYEPCAIRVQHLQTSSETILRREKERLEEGGKELETLAAKLEYEINGLKGRVEEVQAGVGDFERGVGRVEERVGELEKDEEKANRKREWGCVVS